MKNALLRTSPLSSDLAALLLRVLLGGLMAWHGWQKIENYNMILPMFGDIIGIGPKLSFNLAIFAEFGCGILLVLGLFTRLAVIPITITMAVAYFIAHGKDAFQVKELAFVFLVQSVIVFILGSGRFSLDHLLFNKKR